MGLEERDMFDLHEAPCWKARGVHHHGRTGNLAEAHKPDLKGAERSDPAVGYKLRLHCKRGGF